MEVGLRPRTARADAGRRLVSTCLMHKALEGYPVRPLLEDYLVAFDVDAAQRARTQYMVERLLTRWSEMLSQDLERLPTPTPEPLEAIRQRMVSARDALLGARAILHGLVRLAANESNEAQMPDHPIARAGNLGSSGS